MALTTLQPSGSESPDTTQGGLSVTGAGSTGHSATTASRVGAGSQSKTCRWSGFSAAPAGLITNVVLKVDWQEDGTIAGGGTSLFRIQYSTNGGGAWTNVISHTDVTSPAGPTTASVSLSTSQDLTQIQTRDLLQAAGSGGGDSASVTGTVSNIKIEVTTVDAGACGVMM